MCRTCLRFSLTVAVLALSSATSCGGPQDGQSLPQREMLSESDLQNEWILSDTSAGPIEVPREVVADADSSLLALAGFLTQLEPMSATSSRLTLPADDEVWSDLLEPNVFAIVTGSPINSGAQQSIPLGSGDKAILQQQGTKPIPQPDIAAILARPLIANGERVNERFKRREIDSKELAGVYCDGGSLVVGYASDSLRLKLDHDNNLSAYGFVFIREHELGHVELGHVGCNADGSTRSIRGRPELELAADCYAAGRLYGFGDGTRIIDHVRGEFRRIPKGGSDTHPSYRARATNLYDRNCGTTSIPHTQ